MVNVIEFVVPINHSITWWGPIALVKQIIKSKSVNACLAQQRPLAKFVHGVRFPRRRSVRSQSVHSKGYTTLLSTQDDETDSESALSFQERQ